MYKLIPYVRNIEGTMVPLTNHGECPMGLLDAEDICRQRGWKYAELFDGEQLLAVIEDYRVRV